MAVSWTVLLAAIHWTAGPVSLSEAVAFGAPSVLAATILAPAVVSHRERPQWRPRDVARLW